ncbi:UNVERIFIED_ORG: hypothetical protein ABIB52_004188 [Arthrobacter sp. UYCu721]
MTDQPNQERPRKKIRILHTWTLSTARTPAIDTPGDVPAELGTSNETDDPDRKVMSPATENFMK